MLLRPFLRRVLVLGTGIAVGALLATPPSSFGAVADGSCEAFAGISQGNDPSQTMTLHLCRSGNDVWGLKNSSGIAGTSSFRLAGSIHGDVLTMQISDVVSDQPGEGWMTCYDDVYSLRWDGTAEGLIGSYDSAECEDHAELRALRMAAASEASSICSGTSL